MTAHDDRAGRHDRRGGEGLMARTATRMRSDAAAWAERVLRALAARAAAVATLVAVLSFAVSHVEVDHGPRFAPAAGGQAVLVASAPCSPDAPGHAGSAAADCSAPCAAPLPAAPASEGALAGRSFWIGPSRPEMVGMHVGLATPPPRPA